MTYFGSETIVVKHGGSAMDDDEGNRRIARSLAALVSHGHRVVVVHGGGKAISRWMSQLGMETRFIEGLRYTDALGMQVTEMVLSGLINPNLVAHLNAVGMRAVGLSGKDAGLFRAKRIRSPKGEDLGLVGEVVEVQPAPVIALAELGYLPVISSVSSDVDGHTLNVNADYAAASLARSLNADRLIFITDVNGILIGGNTVGHITLPEAEKLLTHPEVVGGMGPKLSRSVEAVRNGVGSVQMVNGRDETIQLVACLGENPPGTTISR